MVQLKVADVPLRKGDVAGQRHKETKETPLGKDVCGTRRHGGSCLDLGSKSHGKRGALKALRVVASCGDNRKR